MTATKAADDPEAIMPGGNRTAVLRGSRNGWPATGPSLVQLVTAMDRPDRTKRGIRRLTVNLTHRHARMVVTTGHVTSKPA